MSIRTLSRYETLYHGSGDIVKNIELSRGYEHTDYGQGFYTTMESDEADAWAALRSDNPVENIYEIDLSGLRILDLDQYGYFVWLAEVLSHRGVGNKDLVETASDFCDVYKTDTSGYDILIGYRVDDSYFSVITAFLNGWITMMDVANYLSNLSTQICLKTEKAVEATKFLGYMLVSTSLKIEVRDADEKARKEMQEYIKKQRAYNRKYNVSKFMIQDCIDHKYVYNLATNTYQ